MVPSIVPDRRDQRRLHRRDKLADRLVAAGFVAVVFLSACTDALGHALPEPRGVAVPTALEAGHE